MAGFDVQILLRLVDKLTAPARNAGKSYQQMANSITNSSRQIQGASNASAASLNRVSVAANTANASVGRLATNMRNMRTLSGGFAGLGLGGGGAMIAAFPLIHMLKSAANYEDALLNIRKVWQGTEQDYERLVGKLRKLNSEIPLTRAEIATIMEEGVKSGVSKDVDELGEFTRQAAKFAKAFELPSVDEAAEKLAKIKGSLDMTMPEFVAMADTMNTVAGNFATTESDLLEYIRRGGATAKSIGGEQGLSDLLTIAGAQTAAGVRREVGATGLRTLLARLSAMPKTTRDGLGQLGLNPDEVSRRLPGDMYGTVLEILEKVAAAPEHERSGILSKIAGMRTFDAFAPLLANLDQLREVKEIVDGAFRLTMAEEYARRITGLNSAFRITANVLGDLSDSIVMAWKPQIISLLTWLRELSESLKGSAILQWTAAFVAGIAALSLLVLPFSILGASLISAKIGMVILAQAAGVLIRIVRPLLRLLTVFAAGELIGLVGGLARAGKSIARVTALAYRFGGALGAVAMAYRMLRRAFMIGLAVEGLILVYTHWKDLVEIAKDPIHLKVIWPEMPEWLSNIIEGWSKVNKAGKFASQFAAEAFNNQVQGPQEAGGGGRTWRDWFWGSSEEQGSAPPLPGRNPLRVPLPERSRFRVPLPEQSQFRSDLGVPEAIAKKLAAEGQTGSPNGVTVQANGPKVTFKQAPPNINISVTVNATTNASPEAIGAAAASAVGSKVRGALSDAPLSAP